MVKYRKQIVLHITFSFYFKTDIDLMDDIQISVAYMFICFHVKPEKRVLTEEIAAWVY